MKRSLRGWLEVISLGYMGGVIWLFTYMRYVFYDQMIQTMQCTNTQLVIVGTYTTILGFALMVPGGYFSDKFDAKHSICVAGAWVTGVLIVFGIWTTYPMFLICSFSLCFGMLTYWASLLKYINNLGSEEDAGSSFGWYYLFNGLGGAIGNAIPLWIGVHFNSFHITILSMAATCAIGVILVSIFLDNEKVLASKGRYLKGDEPIQVRFIPTALKWPGFWALFLAGFGIYGVYAFVAYFNPYLTYVVGIDPEASSALSLIRNYLAMIMAPVGGWLADKVFKSSTKFWLFFLPIIAVLYLVPLTFNSNTNATFAMIYSVLPSFIIFAVYATRFSCIRELHINPVVLGTSLAIVGFQDAFIDAGLTPIFGVWMDKYPMDKAFTMIFVTCALLAVCGFVGAMWIRHHDRLCREGKRVMKLPTELEREAAAAAAAAGEGDAE